MSVCRSNTFTEQSLECLCAAATHAGRALPVFLLHFVFLFDQFADLSGRAV